MLPEPPREPIGVLPLIAAVVFVLVGVAILYNVVVSAINGHGFAVVLGAIFAVLWAAMGAAFWHDLRRRRR